LANNEPPNLGRSFAPSHIPGCLLGQDVDPLMPQPVIPAPEQQAQQEPQQQPQTVPPVALPIIDDDPYLNPDDANYFRPTIMPIGNAHLPNCPSYQNRTINNSRYPLRNRCPFNMERHNHTGRMNPLYVRPPYAVHENLLYRQQNTRELHRRHMTPNTSNIGGEGDFVRQGLTRETIRGHNNHMRRHVTCPLNIPVYLIKFFYIMFFF